VLAPAYGCSTSRLLSWSSRRACHSPSIRTRRTGSSLPPPVFMTVHSQPLTTKFSTTVMCEPSPSA